MYNKPTFRSERSADEQGFTLIETSIAMVIILIVLLGVFYAFTYAINFNAGNASRSQALTVLQQEVEFLRSKKFSPGFTDAELTGGTKPVKTVSAANGLRFTVTDIVDNDPFLDGVQDETVVTGLKEIRVIVRLDSPSPGWQTAVPAEIIMRRTRGN
jgi:prepilin-type N-terminal cleavage/methylation domain-containing protein